MGARSGARATAGVVLAVLVACGLVGCARGAQGAPGDDAGPAVASGDVGTLAPPDGSTATTDPDAVAADPAVVVAPDVAWADHGGAGADALGAVGYSGTVSGIGPDLAARMAPSWRAGCPVPLADLRYVTVTHHDFDGGTATGELVVHADVADSVVAVFGELYDLGYPVRSMRLVDDFGGDDDASMAADNTSAFNCRPISRGTGWSEHAYGRAIDLNPVENPYVRGSLVLPPEGAAFAARTAAPGVVLAGDDVVQAFAAHGWQWGGDWSSPVDYQHFSTTGR